MATDQKYPQICGEVCPVIPLLHTILDEVRSLKNEGATSGEKPLKATGKRPQVNVRVFALLTKYPEKIWTSDSFAKAIGCSAAAVRQTKAWKAYQRQLQNMRQEHLLRKGHKNKWGDIEAFDSHKADDL